MNLVLKCVSIIFYSSKKTRPCLGNTNNIKIPEYEVLDNISLVLHDHDYSLLKETCSEVLLRSVNNFISSYKLYITNYRVKYEYEKETAHCLISNRRSGARRLCLGHFQFLRKIFGLNRHKIFHFLSKRILIQLFVLTCTYSKE